ncbi:MAG TPA: hypothetical protein VL914_01280 [Vicinamibacterales bacterium]|nr:hypothetical protein [Vicinamibacterales bacterium]
MSGVEKAMDLSDIQGLVFHSYRGLPFAAYVLLRFEPDSSAAVQRWLAELLQSDTIDSATPKEAGPRGRPGVRVNVAFTYTGLGALGLDADVRRTFPLAFVEGLGAKWNNIDEPNHRSRALGDVGASAPYEWEWGYQGGTVGRDGRPHPDRRFDALLLIFATTAPERDAEIARLLRSAIARGAIRNIQDETWRVLCGTFPIQNGPVREPFGFVDGVSQPVLRGARGLFGENDKPTQPAIHTLADGEVLLGHVDGARQIAASPIVPAGDRAARLPEARDEPDRRRDLGYNGTYLVFRQLAQDVKGFDDACVEAANQTGILPERLEAMLVGRWRDGSPLIKCPIAHDPDHATAPSGNDFEYRDDPHGERCPMGAHIRRANPRDSLGDNPGESWRVSNRHRILRRGRPYQDGQNQGLHFICLNASIERQFEFIQQNWTNDSTFGGLDQEDDPLVGGPEDAAGRWTFTLPPPADTRFRRRVTLPGLASFVTVRGGAYFFLPSLTALRYLAHLPAAPPPRAEWEPTPQRLNIFEWIRFALLVRFPMLLAAVLIGIPSIVWGTSLRTIMHPMFLTSGPRDMLIVTLLASFATSLAMHAYRVVTLHAADRFGVVVPASSSLTWKRVLIWQMFSLPIVLTTLWLSATDAVIAPGFGALRHEFVRFGLATLGGYVAAFGILLLAEIIRSRSVRPENVEDAMLLPPMRLLDRFKRRPSKIAALRLVRLVEGYVARFPPGRGAGYFERDTGRVLPGHITAGALGFLITLFYLSGWITLWPPSAFQLPPMAYLLFVLSIAGSVGAALAFFLDWFRVPMLTVVLASWIAATLVGGSDHKFAVLTERELSAAPTVREMIDRADSYHSANGGTDSTSRPIVIVAAGGGGAHQAAWTARVLTGLTKLWGTQFTGNLRLISGVSAGSIGAMHFVRQFQNGPLGAGPAGAGSGEGREDPLQRDVVDPAKAGATGDVWWGITYPDLTRTLWPIGAFVPGTLDRGRSLELAWCHAMKLDAKCLTPTMGDWRADVMSGWRPAIAFNAMVVETGQRVVLATYQFPGSATADITWLTGQKDIPVITAARLAASFPYVTAASRPDNSTKKGHLIDGGYWDNHGIVTLLEWLEQADLKGRKVLVVRIPPPAELTANVGDRAWPWQTIAPLQAGLSVRTDAQRNRNDFEIKLLNASGKFDIVWAEFPYQDIDEATDTLLSWHLSRKERCGIEKVWNERYGRASGAVGSPEPPPKGAPEISKIASVLGTPAPWVAPVVEECTP